MKTGRVSTPLQRLHWLKAVSTDPRIKLADLKIAIVFANVIEIETDDIAISVGNIADFTLLNRRTVRRSIASLIDFGYLKHLPTFDPIDHSFNTHRLNMPIPTTRTKVMHRGWGSVDPQGGGPQTHGETLTFSNTIETLEGAGGPQTPRVPYNEPRARSLGTKEKSQKEKRKIKEKRKSKTQSYPQKSAPKTKNNPQPTKPPWKLPTGVNAEAWAEFEVHRKQIREPMSDLARTKNANVLLAIGDYALQQLSVDKTIANRWTGLFFVKPSDTGRSHETSKRPYRETAAERANRIHAEYCTNGAQTVEPHESDARRPVREPGGHTGGSQRMGVVLDGNFRREKP